MPDQRWMVTEVGEDSDLIHVSPVEDIFKHHLRSGQCWCGAWNEPVTGGTIVHHTNLTERVSFAMEGYKNRRKK